MKRILRYRELIICGLLLTLSSSALAVEYVSPVALAYDGGDNLYIADKTGMQVQQFGMFVKQTVRVFNLPFVPEGLAVSQGKLYVTGGSNFGVVFIVDVASNSAEVIPVGHTPMSPVLKGQMLYVCDRFSNAVSVVDLSTKTETSRIAVHREPVAIALTPNGSKLVVAHHLPEGPANDNYNVLKVSIINTSTRAIVKDIDLVNGSTGGRGVCVSPDGAYAYVTHLVGRYQMPTTQLERGWMWTNALSVIDIAAGTLVNTVLLDDVYAGSANPWAVTCSADGEYLCVTHAGSQEVSIIDLPGLHSRLNSVAAGQAIVGGFSDSPADVPNDLSFLTGLRKRVQLIGNGPRSIALAGNYAYVGNYYSESLDAFNITAEYPTPKEYVIGPRHTPSPERFGEQCFNDGKICYQRWLSCASCHPDARMDGMNWDLLNDGLGSPRNAKSMLLSHYSAPAMVTGIRANAPTAVTAGFKFIQFVAVEPSVEPAVNAYLRAMRPVPSPYLINGEYSEAAKRGRDIFFGAAKCGHCHAGNLYIDPSANDDYIAEKLYDVGTNRVDAPTDAERNFLVKDVPTLAEVWRTAPYLQDGRAATMREVLTTYNPTDQHGKTSTLTPQQLDDLEEFVLSIGKSLYSSDAMRADISGPGGEPDGKVDRYDFVVLSSGWLMRNTYSRADISGQQKWVDYNIDSFDLLEMANSWLTGY